MAAAAEAKKSKAPELAEWNGQPAVRIAGPKPMPLFGLGTWQSPKGDVGKAVKLALEAGYRLIDCADIYGNQKEIGEALAEVFAAGKIKREDVFITSKVFPHDFAPEHFDKAVQRILADLKLEYVDLLLLHWPFALKHDAFKAGKKEFDRSVSYQTTYRSLEKAHAAGHAKAIGISNVPAVLAHDVLSYAKVPPAVNQVEMHPQLPQDELVTYLRDENGIAFTGYAPLGSPGAKEQSRLLDDEAVVKVAKEVGATPAQVLLRWGIQRGVSVIPKSTNAKRISENYGALKVKLTEDQMAQLSAVHKTRGKRYFTTSGWVPQHFPVFQ